MKRSVCLKTVGIWAVAAAMTGCIASLGDGSELGSVYDSELEPCDGRATAACEMSDGNPGYMYCQLGSDYDLGYDVFNPELCQSCKGQVGFIAVCEQEDTGGGGGGEEDPQFHMIVSPPAATIEVDHYVAMSLAVVDSGGNPVDLDWLIGELGVSSEGTLDPYLFALPDTDLCSFDVVNNAWGQHGRSAQLWGNAPGTCAVTASLGDALSTTVYVTVAATGGGGGGGGGGDDISFDSCSCDAIDWATWADDDSGNDHQFCHLGCGSRACVANTDDWWDGYVATAGCTQAP